MNLFRRMMHRDGSTRNYRFQRQGRPDFYPVKTLAATVTILGIAFSSTAIAQDKQQVQPEVRFKLPAQEAEVIDKEQLEKDKAEKDNKAGAAPPGDLKENKAVAPGGLKESKQLPAVQKKEFPAVQKQQLPATMQKDMLPAVQKDKLPAVQKDTLPGSQQSDTSSGFAPRRRTDIQTLQGPSTDGTTSPAGPQLPETEQQPAAGGFVPSESAIPREAVELPRETHAPVGTAGTIRTNTITAAGTGQSLASPDRPTRSIRTAVMTARGTGDPITPPETETVQIRTDTIRAHSTGTLP